MMRKVSYYRLIPLLSFVLILMLLTRGLFLQPRVIPSVKLNKSIPKFELSNLFDGKKLDQNILKGQWTVLNVWASWCEACAVEHPFILQLSNEGYNLIGLNYKDDETNAKSWLQNYGNPYKEVLFDKLGNVSIDFGVYGSPETFLIDKNGIIRYRHVGILNSKVWKKSFAPLISQAAT